MEKENQDRKYWWGVGLSIFAKLSAWIVFPVILAVAIGNQLEKIFGMAPWLMFLSVAVAFVVSTWGMIVTALKEFKRLEDNKKEK